jgi:hypothetical protein
MGLAICAFRPLGSLFLRIQALYISDARQGDQGNAFIPFVIHDVSLCLLF